MSPPVRSTQKNEGVMPEVTQAMIADDSFPVRWTDVNETVSLEVDSQRWVAARIQSLDVELPMQYMHPWLGRLCRDNTLVADVVEYRYQLRI